jgi:serine O-acetyltransferase
VLPDLPDWTRERPIRPWDPGRKLLLSIRRYQYWRQAGPGLPRLISKLVVLRYRFWSVITGADIPINGRIGGGLLLLHPNGIVIDQDVVIGTNCTIFQQVTIGDARNSRQKGQPVPVIGNNVEIGAGAKVLGDIRVGDHAKIGANAVVLQDIPPHAIAVGIPARIKRVPAADRYLHHQQRQLPADRQGDNRARTGTGPDDAGEDRTAPTISRRSLALNPRRW